MSLSIAEKADIFRPFDDLLDDRTFWTEFETGLIRDIVPMFLEIFVAGAIAGTKVREKAFPSDLPEPLSYEELAELAEQAILDYVPEFTKNISATTYSQVRESVLKARESGGGVEQVLRDISPLFSRGRAETIAITETTRLFGVGAQASYRLQGFNGWQWHSVNDPWVDPVCAGLNDEKFPMDELFSPAHPRCRCFPSPVHIDGLAPPAPVLPEDVRPGTEIPEGGFKTVKAAEQWTRERFPNLTTVNFTGAKMVNLLPTLQAFDRLAVKYPVVVDRLQTITTQPSKVPGLSRFGSGVMAYATRSGSTIALNPKFFGNESLAAQNLSMATPSMGARWDLEAGKHVYDVPKVQWHPLGSAPVESIFVHEFGHQVENWLALFQDPKIKNLYGDFVRNFSSDRTQMSTLSGYATQSKAEGFAETFSQMETAPRDVWHPATIRLEETLTQIREWN